MNLRHPDTIPIYRENTVESFLRAAEAGATFVEFDVQVCASRLRISSSTHSATQSRGSHGGPGQF